MKVTEKNRVNDGDAQEIEMTITLSAEEMQPFIDEFYAELSKGSVKGFRKGKAPRKVLVQAYGGEKAVSDGIAEKTINTVGFGIVDGEDVVFLDEPTFNVTGQVVEGKEFSFEVSGKVTPEIELSNYEPVSIEMPPDEATDNEVEKKIEELRNFYYTMNTVERPAEMGDFVMTKFTISEDGEPKYRFTNVDRMFELGENLYAAEFDEKLVGVKAGDTVEFDFVPGDGEPKEHLGEGPVHAYVEVSEVREKILPELDDEFAKKVGAMDKDDMYKQLKAGINVQKAKELPELMDKRCIDALCERIECELPEYYVSIILNQVMGEFFRKMQENNESFNLQEWIMNNRGQTEKLQTESRLEAERRAKRDLALDALYRAKKMELTDEDMLEELKGGEDDPQEVIDSWQKAGRLSDLRMMCRRSKAVRWLSDTAEVTVVEE